ncbi:MAG: hypothetical protein Q9210_006893, partial [Variospora velana]
MYYLLLLLTFLLTHHLSSAIPAAPIAQNPPNDGHLVLNPEPEDVNLNRTMRTLVFSGKTYNFSVPARLSVKRPRAGFLWPEGSAGKHFLEFTDFKGDIRWESGQSIL